MDSAFNTSFLFQFFVIHKLDPFPPPFPIFPSAEGRLTSAEYTCYNRSKTTPSEEGERVLPRSGTAL